MCMIETAQLPLPSVPSPDQAPTSPPTGTSTPTPSMPPPTVTNSDTITCGQCASKFYHVTQFLQHKSTCPGNVPKEEETEEAEAPPLMDGAYLCTECPNAVYPSSDLLRLHLLDSHGVYLPAGIDMGSMLQETKAYQVDPDQARKIANRAAPSSSSFDKAENEARSECSDNSNNTEGKEVDSGNDSDIKKDFSAGTLSNSPNGSAGNSSGAQDSGNSEMRSPVIQSVQPSPLKPTGNETPTSLPQLPSTMARSLLESMVANRLRANLEQKNQQTSATPSPSEPAVPQKTPVASALSLFQNPYQHPLMPFQTNPLQAQLLQAQQAAIQQATQLRTHAAAQAAAQAAQQAVQQQQQQQQQQQLATQGDGNLYQPAVKRRRRGYGSEVGTENLKILRDGDGYCCPLCNYKSRVRSNLTIHLRTHTGYKPYKCPYCPYSSSQSGPLKIHIRGHTGEKPYRCDYCSYASTCRGNLKVHQERHHKEEIAKNGLNAGIKGPNDIDDHHQKALPNVVEQKTEQDKSDNQTENTPTSSSTNFPRLPPFSGSFTQLPGIPGMGGHMPFGLNSFGSQMNHQLLAGLLKPKTEGQPHFPLNIGQPGQTQSPDAKITEIKEEKMDS